MGSSLVTLVTAVSTGVVGIRVSVGDSIATGLC